MGWRGIKGFGFSTWRGVETHKKVLFKLTSMSPKTMQSLASLSLSLSPTLWGGKKALILG